MTRQSVNSLSLWIVALAAAIALLLLPFISGFLGAAVLYVLAEPLLRRVTHERNRRAGAFALMFLCFFVLVLPGAWLLAELLGQVPGAVRQFQDSAAVQRLMGMRLGDIEVGTVLRQATSEIVAWSSRQTIAAMQGTVAATLNLIVALFGCYYLLTSGGALWNRVAPHLPVDAGTAELLRLRFHRVTEAMALGVVVAALAQGTLVGGALWALGFEHFLLWGAVTAVASVLPIFGSGLVWIPAVAVLFGQQRFVAAFFLLAYGALFVSNIDNALRLIVYQAVSQIHPMVTLVGAFAGVKAFGLAGLLLGPLVLSYANELVSLRDRQSVGDSTIPLPEIADRPARPFAVT